MAGYLTTEQATREAADVLAAAGLTGRQGAEVSTRAGMQPDGARELAGTEIVLRRAVDYDDAMTALLRAFPDAGYAAGDGKRRARILRYTGRIVGEGSE
jgi:hypothetical protein